MSDDGIFLVCATVLILTRVILTAGDPDLLDAIIRSVGE